MYLNVSVVLYEINTYTAKSKCLDIEISSCQSKMLTTSGKAKQLSRQINNVQLAEYLVFCVTALQLERNGLSSSFQWMKCCSSLNQMPVLVFC